MTSETLKHTHLVLRSAVMFTALCILCQTGCGQGSPEQSKPAPASVNKEWAIGVAAEVFLAAENGAIFYGFDALAHPSEAVELKVCLMSLRKLARVKGATVEYFLDGQSVGRAVTDDQGCAVLKWTPPKTEPASADYELTAKLAAVPVDDLADMLKSRAVPLLVAVRPKDARFVVIDLDHTVVASSFARVLIGGARPMPGAAEVVKELQKDYSLIYLTHRPDLLMAKSKLWLTDNGFPRAPLLVSTLEQAFGDSGQFKAQRLKALRQQYPKLAVGIGDKLSDVQAYADNGMKAYLIPHYDRDKEKDVGKMADEIARLKADVQVVDDWEEIRAGVFGKKHFPARSYVQKLRERAQTLRRESQLRKAKDDDDD